MRQVGAFDAKTHLTQLLDEVSRGERIEITRHGVPVAHLVPPAVEAGPPVSAVIEQLKVLRQGVQPMSSEDIRTLREEGRRF
jgi:prevent-host-death family protein